MIYFQNQAITKFIKSFPNGTRKPQETTVQDANAEEKQDTDTIARNLLQINVYFGSKTVTRIKEIPTYESVML